MSGNPEIKPKATQDSEILIIPKVHKKGDGSNTIEKRRKTDRANLGIQLDPDTNLPVTDNFDFE